MTAMPHAQPQSTLHHKSTQYGSWMSVTDHPFGGGETLRWYLMVVGQIKQRSWLIIITVA